MTYEENYLAHYGIKGQRWGIRRYQNEDGTLTQLGKEHYKVGSEGGTNSKFAKAYSRENKKFQKWAARADVDVQKQKANEYGEKAKAAAKVALGSTLAGAGVSQFPDFETDHKVKNTTYTNIYGYGDIGGPIESEFTYKSTSESKALKQIVSAGAAALAAGAATTAVVYKIKQAKAKKYTEIIGHQKAVANMNAQYKKITNMVKDTPYAALFADQIAAYKKEHPNTELSDKQIMKNLM